MPGVGVDVSAQLNVRTCQTACLAIVQVPRARSESTAFQAVELSAGPLRWGAPHQRRT